jgi:hypothetical protein
VTGSPTEPEAPPGYVLVPVPVDMVDLVGQEVMRLQWMARGVAHPWGHDDLVDLLVEADDLVTTLVRTAARYQLDGKVLLDVAVAEHLGISTRELAGIIREVNDSGPHGVLDLLVLHREHHQGELVREVRMMNEHARRVEEAVPFARRRRAR